MKHKGARGPATLVTALAATALVVSGCASASTSTSSGSKNQTLTKFTVATFPGEVYGLDAIAQQKGFFAAHGLQVTFITPSNGGAGANTALLGGSVDGWATNPEVPLIDEAKGQNVKLAGQLNDWIPYAVQVPASSALAKLKDASFDAKMHALSGKTLGLTGIGALVDLALQAGLAEAKVSASSVHVLGIGNAQAGIAQINAHRIDGYVTYTSSDAGVMAKEAHTIQFATLTGTGAPAVISSLSTLDFATSASYAAAHPQAVKAWVAAEKEAFTWLKANPQQAAQVIDNADYNGQYVSVVRKAVDRLAATNQTANFAVTPTALNGEISLLGKLGVLQNASSLSFDALVLPYAR